MRKLTKQESDQIIGGLVSHHLGDIVNSNKSADCECVYDNSPSAVSNENSVSGCTCKCYIKTTK